MLAAFVFFYAVVPQGDGDKTSWLEGFFLLSLPAVDMEQDATIFFPCLICLAVVHDTRDAPRVGCVGGSIREIQGWAKLVFWGV